MGKVMKCGRGRYKGEVSEGKCWFSKPSPNTGVHRIYLILANFHLFLLKRNAERTAPYAYFAPYP